MNQQERVKLLYKLKDNILEQLANKEELNSKELAIAVMLLNHNKILDIQKQENEADIIDGLVE